VTCTAQSTYLTGVYPKQHGIVANGWYFREECEIKFWRQSNKLVQAPKIWEAAQALDPTFTCANLFWWYNMYSTVDYVVTPRPMYPADGRKIPDVYTQPATLRAELQAQLGPFPLFDFWGPKTSIRSSQWIAHTAKLVDQQYNPTLTLIYLPHLDYNLQRHGPNDPALHTDFQEIDAVCGELLDYYTARQAQIIILSEYGITRVSQPISLNRLFREQGWIAVREELGLELLDAGASVVFAVADHQIAHIYINDPAKIPQVRKILEDTPGIEQVLDEAGKAAYHLNHPRAGDFVAIAQSDAWFTYYYWLDDRRAPDFARTVDIHRKPGYDPVELFVDPTLQFPQLKVGFILLKKLLGFRYLLDIIPLDPLLVKGSHGRVTDAPEDGPLLITHQSHLLDKTAIDATEVYGVILKHLGAETLEKEFP
jgi:predicted AlkP superfamily pyrophosphatase or phosphodiesterase